MKQKIEYLVFVKKPDGTKFEKRIFQKRKDALEYSAELKKKYLNFEYVIHMLEI